MYIIVTETCSKNCWSLKQGGKAQTSLLLLVLISIILCRRRQQWLCIWTSIILHTCWQMRLRHQYFTSHIAVIYVGRMQPICGKHLHCNHINYAWSCLLDYALPGVDHRATVCAITHFNDHCLILTYYSKGCCIVQHKWEGINDMRGNNAFVIVYTAIKLNAKKGPLKYV